MNSKIKICKEYFKQHKALLLEKQFNRKVDMNVSINKFKKDNSIIVRGSEPTYEVFIGEGIDSEFVGQIRAKYGKKGRDLECKKLGYDYKIVIE